MIVVDSQKIENKFVSHAGAFVSISLWNRFPKTCDITKGRHLSFFVVLALDCWKNYGGCTSFELFRSPSMLSTSNINSICRIIRDLVCYSGYISRALRYFFLHFLHFWIIIHVGHNIDVGETSYFMLPSCLPWPAIDSFGKKIMCSEKNCNIRSSRKWQNSGKLPAEMFRLPHLNRYSRIMMLDLYLIVAIV